MNQLIPLSDVKPDTPVLIVQMKASGSIRQRLVDLGFIEGTHLTCILQNGKSFHAFLLRNTVIALRRQDSSSILVTPCLPNA